PGRLPPAATEAPPSVPADRGPGKVLPQRSGATLPPPRWPFAGPAFSGSVRGPGGPDCFAPPESESRYLDIVFVPVPATRSALPAFGSGPGFPAGPDSVPAPPERLLSCAARPAGGGPGRCRPACPRSEHPTAVPDPAPDSATVPAFPCPRKWSGTVP